MVCGQHSWHFWFVYSSIFLVCSLIHHVKFRKYWRRNNLYNRSKSVKHTFYSRHWSWCKSKHFSRNLRLGSISSLCINCETWERKSWFWSVIRKISCVFCFSYLLDNDWTLKERNIFFWVFFISRWTWVAISGIALADGSSLRGYEIKVSKSIFLGLWAVSLFIPFSKSKIKCFNIFLPQVYKRRCCDFIINLGVSGFPAFLKNKLTTIIWPRFNCCHLSCHLYHCCIFVASNLSWLWNDVHSTLIVNKNNSCWSDDIKKLWVMLDTQSCTFHLLIQIMKLESVFGICHRIFFRTWCSLYHSY